MGFLVVVNKQTGWQSSYRMWIERLNFRAYLGLQTENPQFVLMAVDPTFKSDFHHAIAAVGLEFTPPVA